MHEIRIILKQNGRYIQGKFLEVSAVYKARRSDVRHYETQTGGFALQSTNALPQSRFLYKEEQRVQLIITPGPRSKEFYFYLLWFPDYLYL